MAFSWNLEVHQVPIRPKIVPRGSKYPMFKDSGSKNPSVGPESLNVGYVDPLGMGSEPMKLGELPRFHSKTRGVRPLLRDSLGAFVTTDSLA